MNPTFAAKLGLPIWPTGVGTQKFDGSSLATYGMVIAGFSLQDSQGKVRFFEETFLLADTSMEVVLHNTQSKITWQSALACFSLLLFSFERILIIINPLYRKSYIKVINNLERLDDS